MNRAQKLKRQHLVQQTKIVMRTGLSAEEINRLRFEQAYKYLEDVLEVDSYGMEYLPRTGQFWAWWRMEWARVDAIFLQRVPAYVPAREAQRIYQDMHDSALDNRYINTPVMNASRAAIVQQLERSKQVFKP